MAILLGIVSVLAAGLTAWALFHVFFDDMEDLGEAFRYSLTPDIISLFRGEWMEDYWQSMKLGLYLLLVLGAGVLTWLGVYQLVQKRDVMGPPESQVHPREQAWAPPLPTT